MYFSIGRNLRQENFYQVSSSLAVQLLQDIAWKYPKCCTDIWL